MTNLIKIFSIGVPVVMFVSFLALMFIASSERQVETIEGELVILPPDDISYDPLTPATTFEFEDIISPLPLVSITQTYDLIINGADGREAKINFGNEVTYSGDLPVTEAAKLFFDAFNNICQEKRLNE